MRGRCRRRRRAPCAATWAGRPGASGLAAGGVAAAPRRSAARPSSTSGSGSSRRSAARSTTRRYAGLAGRTRRLGLFHQRRPAAAARRRRRWRSPPASSCGLRRRAPRVRFVAAPERRGARQRRAGAPAGRRHAAALRPGIADQSVQPGGAAAVLRRRLAAGPVLGTIEVFGLWWVLLLAHRRAALDRTARPRLTSGRCSGPMRAWRPSWPASVLLTGGS